MQNTNLTIVAAGLLVVFIMFFVYKKSKKTSVSMLVKDPNNAEEFNEPFNKANNNNNTKKLTLKEKVELSWRFLYEITESIVNKFSKEDVELVTQLGHTLLDNGMKYEHVVDLGIKQQVTSRAANIEQQAHSQSQKSLGKWASLINGNFDRKINLIIQDSTIMSDEFKGYYNILSKKTSHIHLRVDYTKEYVVGGSVHK